MVKYIASIMLFLVLISLNAFSTEARLPHTQSLVQNNISALELQISSLQKRNTDLTEEITALRKNMHVLKDDHSKHEEALTTLIKEYKNSNHSSSIGAMLLLFGLMLEIIGAIFIASEILTRKISLIRNLHPKVAMKDLGLDDTAIKDVVGFFTTVGILVVFFGFVIQSMGTLMILNLSAPWWIGIGLAMTGMAVLLIHFVSGRSLEQTTAEKIKILSVSAYFSFIKPLLFKWWRGELCDYCRNPILRKNVYVSFTSEKNTDAYPFSHTPHDFALGHKRCLLKWQNDELIRMNTSEQENEYRSAQKWLDRDEFLSWFKPMPDWHQQWRTHWAGVRKKDLGDGPWYIELSSIIGRLNR